MLKKKEEKAESLGLTLQEYENRRVDDKRKKEEEKEVVVKGLTEDGRRRISESLKKRWQDPVYRERILGGYLSLFHF